MIDGRENATFDSDLNFRFRVILKGTVRALEYFTVRFTLSGGETVPRSVWSVYRTENE